MKPAPRLPRTGILLWVALLNLGLSLHPGLAQAEEGKPAKSNEAEARALLDQALNYVKQHGLEKAMLEFNRLDSPFNTTSSINKHGDLYLYTVDYKGYQAVHGKNPKIRGQVTLKMRDMNGVYLIKEMAEKCKTKGQGAVNYVWPNPITQILEYKTGIVKRIPGTEICLGTGIYHDAPAKSAKN